MRNVALGWLVDNPVITKELRGRMRGSRAYWMLLAYLLLLAVAMLLKYYSWRQNIGGYAGAPASFTVGRDFFRIMFYVQATLVTLITPALTSGAVSIEREQRTFDLMRCTTLRPASIVAGKLASSISFVALLLICSLPLVSICFLLGGVAPDEVIAAYAMLIVDGLLFGAMGIVWSTCAANTAGATALAYLSVAVYFLLTLVPASEAQMPQVSGLIPLSALNPVGAATCASVTEHYFHAPLPAWVAGVIVNGLLTVLLCRISMNRMEDYPWRRAGAVRVTAFLFTAAVLVFVDGASISLPIPAGFPWHPLAIAFVGLTVLVLFLPPFATGDPTYEVEHGIEPQPPTWNPVLAFREATMRTSPLISMLLVAVIVAVTMLTARSTTFTWSTAVVRRFYSPNAAGPNVATAVTTSLQHVWYYADFIRSVGVLFVCVGLGIVGLGNLYSTLLRNRWGAIIFVYLTILFAAIVPWIMYGMMSQYDLASIKNFSSLNWLYASPLSALAAMGSVDIDDAYRHLWLSGAMPPWMATSIVYAFVGIVTLWLATALRVGRQPAKSEAVAVA